MSTIITFANQKGGCGKSTVLSLFAAYLVKMQNKKVFVIDTDKQRTLLRFYEQEKRNFDQEPLYEVVYLESQGAYNFINSSLEEKTIYLIDTPNQLSIENFNLLKFSDKIIVPYNYSKASMTSTLTFLDVCIGSGKINLDNLFFIGNCIKGNVKKDSLDKFKELVRKDIPISGNVLTNDLKDTIQAQRISYLRIADDVIELFEESFRELYSKLNF